MIVMTLVCVGGVLFISGLGYAILLGDVIDYHRAVGIRDHGLLCKKQATAFTIGIMGFAVSLSGFISFFFGG